MHFSDLDHPSIWPCQDSSFYKFVAVSVHYFANERFYRYMLPTAFALPFLRKTSVLFCLVENESLGAISNSQSCFSFEFVMKICIALFFSDLSSLKCSSPKSKTRLCAASTVRLSLHTQSCRSLNRCMLLL